jgi:hypothetical protein
MQTATKVALYWIAIIATVCGLSLTAHAAQPTQPTTQPTQSAQPAPSEDVPTAEDFRKAIESYGESTQGMTIIVTDDPALNCGSAKSVGHTGGGCTWKGGTGHALLFISPNADDHVLMHEYAHAHWGVGECAAENFSNTITMHTEWAYPSCAKGIEP